MKERAIRTMTTWRARALSSALWLAVAGCATESEAPTADGPSDLATTSFEGWSLAGSEPEQYEVALAGEAAVLRSRGAETHKGFGTLMQTLSAERYRGQRVRFAADVEALDVRGWAGLWMRVDGEGDERLAFDNMEDRAIRGSVARARYEVVLDVPREASAVAFGVLLSGIGEVRMSALALEVVDRSTPTTVRASRVPSAHAQNLGFEDVAGGATTPAGWFTSGAAPGDYSMERDTEYAYSGEASARLRPSGAAPRGFATLMQLVQPGELSGARVRMRAMMRGEDLDGWAALWMRIDRGGDGRTLAFDNMQDRPLSGTFDWREVEIVLDVPGEAGTIAFGVLQTGRGTIWIDDVSFEVVGEDVPSTSLMPRRLPDAPQNLELQPSR